jgi:GT2 family glycosyltransferase
VAAGFPDFRLIGNPDNRGFTGGMNTGLKATTGKYVLLTEDDIVLDPGAIGEIVRHLEDSPSTGLAGALMMNKVAGTIRCAGGKLELGPRFAIREIAAGQATLSLTSPYPVTYLPGAFILGRRDLLVRIGGFWEELFMYQDDVDLCLRLAKAGARIDVVPTAVVRHFDPPDGPEPGWLTDLKVRNLLWLYVRHAPPDVLLVFVARYYLFGMVRSLASGRRLAWSRARALAMTVFCLPRLLSLRWGHHVSS